VRGVFVTGTDTGVGKTVLSAALLAAAAPDACYAKPIQTGSPPDDDVATVRTLTGVASARAPDLGVRLRAPVSPHHAAETAGVQLTVKDLARRLRAADDPPRGWVVEGAGGLLVPLNERETLADLVRELRLPVVVAVGVRLGAINTTLLTLRALRDLGLPTLGVVLMGARDPSLDSALAAHAPGAVLGGVPTLTPLTQASVREAGRTLLRVPALLEALG